MEPLQFICHGEACNPVISLAAVLICAFFAVLFGQSSMDKVLDWKGNLEWLQPHFENSFLAPMTVPLVAVITLLEVLSCLTNAGGAAMLLATGSKAGALTGLLLASVTLLQLFAGQRIAKDYAGAHQVLGYFVLAIIGLLFVSA